MKIAICDDCREELYHLAALIETYQTKRDIDFICNSFLSGIDLIEDVSVGNYDMILLDVVMPGLSGIQIAEEIRQFNKVIKIVLLSTSSEFAVDSYSVGAYNYLIKPVGKAEIFSLLDKINAELGIHNDDGIILKGRDGIVRLVFSSIEYVEVMNKTVSFHLIDGTIKDTSGALSDFEPQLLARNEFIKAHRSYIINLKYVQTLNSKGIITAMDHTVPISKTLYSQTKELYMKYLFVKGNEAKKYIPAPVIKTVLPSNTEVKNGGYRILLVDDEATEQSFWADILIAKGCAVDIATNIEAASTLASEKIYDCIVLDVMLSGESSFSHCQQLRELTKSPVIFLSSLTDSGSQLQGFLSGGIDYITKDTPKDLFWAKVETRIKLARTGKVQLSFGALLIDLTQRKVYVDGEELVLTPTEFDLLWLLAEHAERIYTPEALYHAIWGTGEWDGGQSVQVHLSRMRRKLERACSDHCFVETVWGDGYRFVPHKEIVSESED